MSTNREYPQYTGFWVWTTVSNSHTSYHSTAPNFHCSVANLILNLISYTTSQPNIMFHTFQTRNITRTSTPLPNPDITILTPLSLAWISHEHHILPISSPPQHQHFVSNVRKIGFISHKRQGQVFPPPPTPQHCSIPHSAIPLLPHPHHVSLKRNSNHLTLNVPIHTIPALTGSESQGQGCSQYPRRENGRV
jgi:hypothetical protein